MIMTNQFLSIVSSFFVKKFKVNFEQIRSYHYSDVPYASFKIATSFFTVILSLLMLKKQKTPLRQD